MDYYSAIKNEGREGGREERERGEREGESSREIMLSEERKTQRMTFSITLFI